jgi:hypothetical protein
MVYEVRFQTVDPERRADYVEMYKEPFKAAKRPAAEAG